MTVRQAKYGNPANYNTTPATRNDEDPSALEVDASGNLLTSASTLSAGEDLVNDVLKVEDRSSYTNLTASALIKTGAGRVKGWSVNSHSSGTLKLWDNTSAATTTLLNTVSFAAGPSVTSLPDVEFSTGLYATIAGTLDITIFWK